MDSLEQLAQGVYRAYGGVTGGKNFQGNPMPAWEELTDTIRQAWLEATSLAYHAGYADRTAGRDSLTLP